MEITAADFNWLLEGWDERRYRKHLEQFLECEQCTRTLVLPYYSEYHPVSIHMQLAQSLRVMVIILHYVLHPWYSHKEDAASLILLMHKYGFACTQT